MKEIKVVLLYPPHQSWTDTMCKPNGSLAYPNLAGALQEIGVDVEFTMLVLVMAKMIWTRCSIDPVSLKTA